MFVFVCACVRAYVQRLYYVQESHGIVVTDLAFLPEGEKGQNMKGNNEAAMFSVAVDSRCQIHTVPNRSKFFLCIFFLMAVTRCSLCWNVLQEPPPCGWY